VKRVSSVPCLYALSAPSCAATAALAITIMLAALPLPAQVLTLPKADVDYDHAVDFHAFRTYQWKDTQDRLPNPARHAAMVTAIERELERKGLTKTADGKPDVRVRFYASVEKHLRGASRQSEGPWNNELRTSVDIEKMAEGTLIVELYEASTDERVWRGTTTRVFRDSALDEDAIRSAVALVLRTYPPPASPKP
jgi:uncharacterized protein DUF4136